MKKRIEYGIKMHKNGLFYLVRTIKWWRFKWDIIIDSGSYESMAYEYKKLNK